MDPMDPSSSSSSPVLNVEHVFVAEFDLDLGSVLRCSYPMMPIGTEESHISEQMLPDGSHNTTKDWTVFFLNRNFESRVTELKEPNFYNNLVKSGNKPLEAIVHSWDDELMQWNRVGNGDSEIISYVQPVFAPASSSSASSSAADTPADAPIIQTVFNGEIIVSDMYGSQLLTIPLHDSMEFSIVDRNYKDSGNVLSTLRNTSKQLFGFEFFLPEQEHTLGKWADSYSLLKKQSIESASKQTREEGEQMKKEKEQDDSVSSPPPVAATAAAAAAPVTPTKQEPIVLSCLNYVRTKKDAAKRRGASVRALAISSRHPYFYVFRLLLQHYLDTFFESDPQELARCVFEAANAVDLSRRPVFSSLRSEVLRWTIVDSAAIKWPIRLRASPIPSIISPPSAASSSDSLSDLSSPPSSAPSSAASSSSSLLPPSAAQPPKTIESVMHLALRSDEVGDDRVSVTRLVEKFREGVMTIFNALLSEKRIIFIGNSQTSASDVVFAVLSAVLLISPPLQGTLLRRAFPYANLVNLDFLNVPGFIAGCMNPMFEHRANWWDLLCDVDTGKIKRNPTSWPHSGEAPYTQTDRDFYQEILVAMSPRVSSRFLRSISVEDTLRHLFETYTRSILDLAFRDVEFASEENKSRAYEENNARLATWRQTKSYDYYKEQRKMELEQRPSKDANLLKCVKRLRVRRNLSTDSMLSLYEELLRGVQSEDEILELLSYLREPMGGLQPISIALFHPSEALRSAAVLLLQKLDSVKEGSRAISTLNMFFTLAFSRSSRREAEEQQKQSS